MRMPGFEAVEAVDGFRELDFWEAYTIGRAPVDEGFAARFHGQYNPDATRRDVVELLELDTAASEEAFGTGDLFEYRADRLPWFDQLDEIMDSDVVSALPGFAGNDEADNYCWWLNATVARRASGKEKHMAARSFVEHGRGRDVYLGYGLRRFDIMTMAAEQSALAIVRGLGGLVMQVSEYQEGGLLVPVGVVQREAQKS